MVELVFVVSMGLKSPFTHIDAMTRAAEITTRHRVSAVVLMQEAHEELLGVVLDDFDISLARPQGLCQLGGHLLAGDVLPGAF